VEKGENGEYFFHNFRSKMEKNCVEMGEKFPIFRRDYLFASSH
jgi:hypothetical protein